MVGIVGGKGATRGLFSRAAGGGAPPLSVGAGGGRFSGAGAPDTAPLGTTGGTESTASGGAAAGGVAPAAAGAVAGGGTTDAATGAGAGAGTGTLNLPVTGSQFGSTPGEFVTIAFAIMLCVGWLVS